jgi:hypothetical protein
MVLASSSATVVHRSGSLVHSPRGRPSRPTGVGWSDIHRPVRHCRSANLTVAETAQAAGVVDDAVAQAEAEQPIPASAVAAIEGLIEQLDWR